MEIVINKNKSTQLDIRRYCTGYVRNASNFGHQQKKLSTL